VDETGNQNRYGTRVVTSVGNTLVFGGSVKANNNFLDNTFVPMIVTANTALVAQRVFKLE